MKWCLYALKGKNLCCTVLTLIAESSHIQLTTNSGYLNPNLKSWTPTPIPENQIFLKPQILQCNQDPNFSALNSKLKFLSLKCCFQVPELLWEIFSNLTLERKHCYLLWQCYVLPQAWLAWRLIAATLSGEKGKASSIDLKRIQTPHKFFRDFWADKTLTTHGQVAEFKLSLISCQPRGPGLENSQHGPLFFLYFWQFKEKQWPSHFRWNS